MVSVRPFSLLVMNMHVRFASRGLVVALSATLFAHVADGYVIESKYDNETATEMMRKGKVVVDFQLVHFDWPKRTCDLDCFYLLLSIDEVGPPRCWTC